MNVNTVLSSSSQTHATGTQTNTNTNTNKSSLSHLIPTQPPSSTKTIGDVTWTTVKNEEDDEKEPFKSRLKIVADQNAIINTSEKEQSELFAKSRKLSDEYEDERLTKQSHENLNPLEEVLNNLDALKQSIKMQKQKLLESISETPRFGDLQKNILERTCQHKFNPVNLILSRSGFMPESGTLINIEGQQINANKVCEISGKLFIIGESPRTDYVNSYWGLLLNSDCFVIDLTTQAEKGNKDLTKIYYPQKINEVIEISGFKVTCEEQDILSKDYPMIVKSTYSASGCQNKVNRYSCEEMGQNILSIDMGKFIEMVKGFYHVVKNTNQKQCLIHCVAGIERSPTLLVSIAILEAIENKQITDQDSLFKFIVQMVMECKVNRSEKCFKSQTYLFYLWVFGNTMLMKRQSQSH